MTSCGHLVYCLFSQQLKHYFFPDKSLKFALNLNGVTMCKCNIKGLQSKKQLLPFHLKHFKRIEGVCVCVVSSNLVESGIFLKTLALKLSIHSVHKPAVQTWYWSVAFKQKSVKTALFSNGARIAFLRIVGKIPESREEFAVSRTSSSITQLRTLT